MHKHRHIHIHMVACAHKKQFSNRCFKERTPYYTDIQIHMYICTQACSGSEFQQTNYYTYVSTCTGSDFRQKILNTYTYAEAYTYNYAYTLAWTQTQTSTQTSTRTSTTDFTNRSFEKRTHIFSCTCLYT